MFQWRPAAFTLCTNLGFKMNHWVWENEVTSQFSLIIQKSNIQVTLLSLWISKYSVFLMSSYHTLPHVSELCSHIVLSPGWEGWVLSPYSLSPAHNMALSFPLPLLTLLADLSAVNVPRTPGQAAVGHSLHTTPVCPREQQLIVVNVCLVHFGGA